MANIDTATVVSTAQILSAHKGGILAAMNNTKRRLTAQFNDSKRKEDEEKCNLVESISDFYDELCRLNMSIEAQKKERRIHIENNWRKEEQDHAFAFENILQTLKGTYQMSADDHKRILEGMQKNLNEQQKVLQSKQTAQLEKLQPPKEMIKSLVKDGDALERCLFESEAICSILVNVIDAEQNAFHTEIIRAEALDRNTIFTREETRLLAEKRVEEDKLAAVRANAAKEKSDMEVAIAQLILQQRQHQGEAEMYLHEIRQTERNYDEHQKQVAEMRFKRTAAYKLQKAKGLLNTGINTGIINPLKFVAKTTTDAIIPKHEAPPSQQELEKRSEEKRMLRDQCSSYLAGLRTAIEAVGEDTLWMEQQTEMVKALLCNDDLGIDQLGARVREILQQRRPADGEDGDEESEDQMNHTMSRRSVSSIQSSRGW